MENMDVFEEKPVGLFDMDGTLFDYEGQLRKDLIALMSPEESMPENLWDESLDYIKNRMDLIKSIPGWWAKLPLLQMGWDIFNVATNLDFELEVLTKGPRSKSLAWKEKLESITIVAPNLTVNIVGKNKSLYYGRFLVEDYTPYLAGWLKHRPRGLGILIDNKSNRDFAHPNVIRYNGENLSEIERHLVAVRKRKNGEHWSKYL